MKKKIFKNIALTITMTLILGVSAGATKASAEIPNSTSENGVVTVTVTRPTREELTEILTDSDTKIVYKRKGDIKEAIEVTLPEITFKYFRNGISKYYLRWFRSQTEKPGYGYFVARQSNYWNPKTDTKRGKDATHPQGFQKGYKIWNASNNDGDIMVYDNSRSVLDNKCTVLVW